MDTTSALPPESVMLSPLDTSFVSKRYTSFPLPPTKVSTPAPPSKIIARLEPVILSFPPAPLIVIVSDPLVKLVAVILVKLAVSPESKFIIRLDVPAAVSLNESVSPVN